MKVYLFDLLAYSREIFMERRFAREVLPHCRRAACRWRTRSRPNRAAGVPYRHA
jgi:hypothetical protein